MAALPPGRRSEFQAEGGGGQRGQEKGHASPVTLDQEILETDVQRLPERRPRATRRLGALGAGGLLTLPRSRTLPLSEQSGRPEPSVSRRRPPWMERRRSRHRAEVCGEQDQVKGVHSPAVSSQLPQTGRRLAVGTARLGGCVSRTPGMPGCWDPRCGSIPKVDKELTLSSSSRERIWALPLTAGCDPGQILRPLQQGRWARGSLGSTASKVPRANSLSLIKEMRTGAYLESSLDRKRN